MAERSNDRRGRALRRRARRFPIRARVRYRADDGRWRQGTSENISRNGLLLHGADALIPATPVDVVVDLPPAVAGAPAATLVCRGHVSRTLELLDVGDITVALALTHCRIGRIGRIERDTPNRTTR